MKQYLHALPPDVLNTGATKGFRYIPRMAGTPSGTPVDTSDGVAMVWDTENKRLWIYDPTYPSGWYYVSFTQLT